jgi:hypothetical protein
MALIPGTLPNDTCYGTPQDLLELFAQYLDVPAFALSSKVVFSTTNTGFTSDIVWFDTTSATRPIMKITVSASGFLDYVKNYITAAPVVTIVGADSVLILDASDSGNTKRGLVSDIASLVTPAKVVQIVEGSTTTVVTTTSGSFVDTGLTVSITPTSASNKVLILLSQNTQMSRAQSSCGVFFEVLRDATALFTGTCDNLLAVGNSTDTNKQDTWAFQYLDSPATTSATTYKVQGAVLYTANGGQAQFQFSSSRSSILAIEVTP